VGDAQARPGLVGKAFVGTPGCVTKWEFNHVAVGIKMSRVHQIFDTQGSVLSGDVAAMVRVYRICGLDHYALGMFYMRPTTWEGVPTCPWRLRMKDVSTRHRRLTPA